MELNQMESTNADKNGFMLNDQPQTEVVANGSLAKNPPGEAAI